MLRVKNACFKLGVVGVGVFGEVHLRSLLTLEDVSVEAICDIDKKRLAEVAKRYSIDNSYSNLDSMLDDQNLDGVVIATPDHLHLQPVKKVAAKKIPILLEKPLATTLEDANGIVNIVEETGVRVLMGFIMRWVPEINHLRQAIQDGRLGKITNVYTRRITRQASANRFKGRCTINEYLAVHDLDLMLWLLGSDLKTIYTIKGDFVVAEKYGTPDFYWNILRWSNGAVGVIHVAWDEQQTHLSSHKYVGENEFIIKGTKGSARLSRPSENLRYYLSDKYETVDLTPYHLDELKFFIDCIRGDVEISPNVYDGLAVVKIIHAAENSVREGKPVKVCL